MLLMDKEKLYTIFQFKERKLYRPQYLGNQFKTYVNRYHEQDTPTLHNCFFILIFFFQNVYRFVWF
jgi:hypothetical protein